MSGVCSAPTPPVSTTDTETPTTALGGLRKDGCKTLWESLVAWAPTPSGRSLEPSSARCMAAFLFMSENDEEERLKKATQEAVVNGTVTVARRRRREIKKLRFLSGPESERDFFGRRTVLGEGGRGGFRNRLRAFLGARVCDVARNPYGDMREFGDSCKSSGRPLCPPSPPRNFPSYYRPYVDNIFFRPSILQHAEAEHVGGILGLCGSPDSRDRPAESRADRACAAHAAAALPVRGSWRCRLCRSSLLTT